MRWKIDYNQEEDVAEMPLQSHFNFKDIPNVDFAVNEVAKRRNTTKIFIDLTLAILDFNRANLFELPSRFYSKWAVNPSTRIALIEPLDIAAKTKAKFYVFATTNLGWFVNMFANRIRL